MRVSPQGLKSGRFTTEKDWRRTLRRVCELGDTEWKGEAKGRLFQEGLVEGCGKGLSA